VRRSENEKPDDPGPMSTSPTAAAMPRPSPQKRATSAVAADTCPRTDRTHVRLYPSSSSYSSSSPSSTGWVGRGRGRGRGRV